VVAAEANLNYEERPTITYILIEGREFSERMLSAIPSETMFTAAQQGVVGGYSYATWNQSHWGCGKHVFRSHSSPRDYRPSRAK
jgi:hypothetical protein